MDKTERKWRYIRKDSFHQYKLMDDTGHSGGGYFEGWMAEEKLAFLRKYL